MLALLKGMREPEVGAQGSQPRGDPLSQPMQRCRCEQWLHAERDDSYKSAHITNKAMLLFQNTKKCPCYADSGAPPEVIADSAQQE